MLLCPSLVWLLLACLSATVTLADNNEYILELTNTADLLKRHADDISHVRYTYDSDLLTGAAVQFKDKDAAERVLDNADVKRAWPVHHRAFLHAPMLTQDSRNEEAHVSDNETDIGSLQPQESSTIPLLTSVYSKFRGLKNKGTNIKIGIIDSGVDYMHPALGGCFGKGCKVAYGYDLVGNNFNGSTSTIQEGNDPIDNCPANSTTATGHGTFVAGIIGAEDKVYNWTGVAPGATLGMWRVFSCQYSGAPNDVVLKAMEMAYKAGMDVINVSLGISGGWDEDVLSVMADRLVAKGVHVVTASGNSGTSGIFLPASPASGREVIAVGSTMNDFVPGYILKLIKSKKKQVHISYRTFTNTAITLQSDLSIKATGEHFNQTNDACQPLHHGKHNHLNNSIVLIHQGGNCSSLQKVQYAKEAGAKIVLFYTDDKNMTTSFETLSAAVLPVAFINNDDGEQVFKAVSKSSKKTKARFTSTLVAMEAPESDLDTIASFSSLGPTNELELKPELVAVGGNVFSTVPAYLGSYRFASGTSFSAPYVAGNIALLLSHVEEDSVSPAWVKNVLMNFASTVKPPISASPYGDSPIRQGAGRVDVSQAIQGLEHFHVSPAKLSLNDSAHFNQEHEITVHNHKQTTLTVNLGHLPSLTATGYSLKEGKNQSYTPTEPVGLYGGNESSVATLHFSSSSLVIPAGESAKVRVRIEPPVDVFRPENHAIYGGYITVASTEDEEKENKKSHQSAAVVEASIPYFGMIGNMIDLPILDRSSHPSPAAPYPFPSIAQANGTVVDKAGHFHIKYVHKLKQSAGGPYILVRLLTGTASLEIQIMDKDGDDVLGVLPPDEARTYMMRNTLGITDYSSSFYNYYWSGLYVPKKHPHREPKLIESGEYRLRVRTLSVFGDREKEQDWDEWTSSRFSLDIDTI